MSLRSQSIVIARASVARTSPRLPPSASSASAMAGARDGDTDVAECGGDRRMRLVNGHPHRCHFGKAREDRIGDRAGRGLDQPIALGAERPARDFDDLVVADRVGELVGMRGGRKINVKDEIELEGLPDFGLMLHHAVIGMQREARNEDGVGHRASRMAFATRSACTVSATSWVRTMVAPLSTATRWLTIEPPRR